MKSDFYFVLKALFVLEIFTKDEKRFLFRVESSFRSLSRLLSRFLSRFFDSVEKQLNKKPKLDVKIYDVTGWTANNCNTHITQYRKT